MDVKVIPARTPQPLSDPKHRVFRIADFSKTAATLKASRVFTAEEFAAVVLTLLPGQEQEVHIHPATTHVWFIISGTGLATLDEDRTEIVGPGMLCVHPHGTIHGLRNTGTEPLMYVTISMGAGF